MKKVIAIAPYIYKHGCNFKMHPFISWERIGGMVGHGHYPPEKTHGFAYHIELPTFWNNKKKALLRFAQAQSLCFDTFPEYTCYEIIPLIWDCWPMFFEKTCKWLKRHRVKTAIFTSSQTAERIKQCFPKMSILTITEGICTDGFERGETLNNRKINLFEMGSIQRGYFQKKYPEQYKVLHNKPEGWENRGQDDLHRFLENSKLTVIFPRSITEPETAQGIETLTQRYWECMLSRILMVGHAPKELTDLVGYNPVIEMDMEHDLEQIEGILSDINNPKYQELVDRNRETALRMGSWDIRMKQIMEWLRGLGYEV